MRKTSSGVTLIELMVVMVIIAILTAIAYPSYRAQVLRSNRSEGKVALEQTVQSLERCYTRSNTYYGCVLANCSLTPTTGCVTLPYTTPSGYYTISIATAAGTPTQFTLTATTAGTQTADTKCATLTLNDTGVRNATGTDASRCWR